MKIHTVCMRPWADRVLPRYSRYLQEHNGWKASEQADPDADWQYLLNYDDGWSVCSQWEGKMAAWFTHKEEEKAAWDVVAERVEVRVAQAKLYGDMLEQYGPTVVAGTPVERERFTIAPFPAETVIGTGGFCRGERKGAFLLERLLEHEMAKDIELIASGEGWPIPTEGYPWVLMPQFYHKLRVYLCTSLIEGGPQGPFEALSCGVPVVIPTGVGALDEIPDANGVFRYKAGDFESMVAALDRACACVPNRKELRSLTEDCDVKLWCKRIEEAVNA